MMIKNKTKQERERERERERNGHLPKPQPLRTERETTNGHCSVICNLSWCEDLT
jgi:hypothetical protein